MGYPENCGIIFHNSLYFDFGFKLNTHQIKKSLQFFLLLISLLWTLPAFSADKKDLITYKISDNSELTRIKKNAFFEASISPI